MEHSKGAWSGNLSMEFDCFVCTVEINKKDYAQALLIILYVNL